MSASEILRRAAALVAAGWSPGDKPLDALGNPTPIYGGTVGDTARAGVNQAITLHTLYSAVCAAAWEAGLSLTADVWLTINAAITASGYTPGGTNFLHPVLGFNTAEGRTAEQVQALLNQVADRLDPSRPANSSADRLPPVTL